MSIINVATLLTSHQKKYLSVLVLLRGLDQMLNDLRLHARVTRERVGQLTVRQGLVQMVRRHRGTHDVIPSLYDAHRNMTNLVQVGLLQQKPIPGKESLVSEVVVLNAGKRQSELLLVVLELFGSIGDQLGDGTFPHRPGNRSLNFLC